MIDLKNLRRDLDIQGELERSMIPNREVTAATVDDKATRVYASGSLATHSGPAAAATQQPASASSLEYAVIQAKSHKLLTSIIALVLLAAVLLPVTSPLFQGAAARARSIHRYGAAAAGCLSGKTVRTGSCGQRPGHRLSVT